MSRANRRSDERPLRTFESRTQGGRNAMQKRFKGWVFFLGYFTLMQFHLQEEAVLNLSGSQF